jgi:modulator of FtsH protease HflC
MKSLIRSAAVAVVIITGVILFNLFTYSVSEGENVILTQFGKPVDKPITTAGLHFKLPMIQTVNRVDVRIQEWDGQAVNMPTRDKLYIIVDSFGRWRISDPLLWFTRLRDVRSALSRIEDITGSENRNAVAKNDLIEIVRTDKNRQPVLDASLKSELVETNAFVLPPITNGRTGLEKEVLTNSAAKLKEFGIDLIDVRFKRINYSPGVTEQINSRMISERKQIADRFRSEGEGEAAKILGNKERELQQITSEAYKTVQKIRGESDATATEIYAKAYNQSPEARELYNFLRTMDTYKKIATNDITMVLSTESELFRLFKESTPPPMK